MFENELGSGADHGRMRLLRHGYTDRGDGMSIEAKPMKTTELVSKLRMAGRGLGSEDPAKYAARGLTVADAYAAADLISTLPTVADVEVDHKALVSAVRTLGHISATCFGGSVKRVGDEARHALQNINTLLGDEAYNRIADEALAAASLPRAGVVEDVLLEARGVIASLGFGYDELIAKIDAALLPDGGSK
jgi:hypothetical protein